MSSELAYRLGLQQRALARDRLFVNPAADARARIRHFDCARQLASRLIEGDYGIVAHHELQPPPHSAITAAIDALKVAANCGGDLDKPMYRQAYENLMLVREKILEHDARLNRQEHAATGNDYNDVLGYMNLPEVMAFEFAVEFGCKFEYIEVLASNARAARAKLWGELLTDEQKCACSTIDLVSQGRPRGQH